MLIQKASWKRLQFEKIDEKHAERMAEGIYDH